MKNNRLICVCGLVAANLLIGTQVYAESGVNHLDQMDASLRDVVQDIASIEIRDESMLKLCPDKQSCSMKFSELVLAMNREFNRSKMELWSKTDCGVPFKVNVMVYDCGADGKLDLAVFFSGYSLFDCSEEDHSGVYVFIHHDENGKNILADSESTWKRSEFELKDKNAFERSMDPGVHLYDRRIVNIERGVLDSECRITTAFAMNCSQEIAYDDGNGTWISLADITISKDGRDETFYGFCGLISDETVEEKLMNSWKMSSDRVQKMVSGVMKFKEPLSSLILSSEAIEKM